jgi:glycosyltransferase involved in cell wall biosynthesis
VFFFPAVAPDVVLDYTSSADIGIAFIENTCLSYYFCLPNKLFEYAMVGLPVIVSNMKEMREIIEKYKWGIVVEDDEVSALMKAIDLILEEDLTQMKKNARIWAEENAWEMQEKIILQAYRGRFLH